MLDEATTPESALPASGASSKPKTFYEHLVEDGHVASQGESTGVPVPEGFDSAKFSSKDIAKRWEKNEREKKEHLDNTKIVYEDELKKITNDSDFDPAKFNTKAIKDRWQNIEDLDKEINKYERWVKGAGGPTSKLGKVYWKTLLRLQSEKDLITDPTLGGKQSRKGWRDYVDTSLPIKPRVLNDLNRQESFYKPEEKPVEVTVLNPLHNINRWHGASPKPSSTPVTKK